jgi:hypothetical protein
MSTNNTPNWGGPSIGQRIDEAIELIQMELRHAVAYVNDAVIPQVRRESIQGLRTAADTLRTLADRFEQRSNAAAGPRSNRTEDSPQKLPENRAVEESRGSMKRRRGPARWAALAGCGCPNCRWVRRCCCWFLNRY